MTTGLILVLFLIQLITIFVIVILYSKLSKFKDLENRQNQLVEEMDNAISVYLIEMKEENDRLIKELQTAPERILVHEQEHPIEKEAVPNILLNKSDSSKVENTSEFEARPYVPVKTAANAYRKQKANVIEENEVEEVQEVLFQQKQEQKLLTFEQQVIEHYHNGKTIEEIARLMQRGKTEIELLVKFHA
jgi:hypothetical protein